MNIFFLDKDPVVAAQCHVDSHVVKMCLETAQILSTAQRSGLMPSQQAQTKVYKATHARHPSVVWACSSSKAYEWTFKLFEALLDEYDHRYGKLHASTELLETLRVTPRRLVNDATFIENLPTGLRGAARPFQPPCAMPSKYLVDHKGNPFKYSGDTLKDQKRLSALLSYRKYYSEAKFKLHAYTKRERPEWLVRTNLTYNDSRVAPRRRYSWID